jgi:acyl phosphate:glycerol-3-phosphate acyltransferase
MNFLAIAAAYLLGGIPFGYVLVKLKTGADVRAAGSGNIGATNVHRIAGRLAGILTLVLDAAKGYFALWLAAKITGANPATNQAMLSIAAVAVMLGHIYTPFLHFKGGKGVATFVGVFLFLAPFALAAIVLVFGVTVVGTRYVSLGSIACAITFPLAVWLIQRPSLPVLAASFICSALVLYRHRDNFVRLHAGTEPVFSWGGGPP